MAENQSASRPQSRLSLYIAASLDGYIARSDGSIDWLVKHENPSTDYGYGEYYASVDALLMGRKTYVVAAGFGPWPHSDRPCYVLSRSEDRFMHAEAKKGEFAAVIGGLKARYRKIWLVGGGELVRQAVAAKSLDEIVVTVIPIILGSGIALFPQAAEEVELAHVETRSYAGGLTQLKYELRYTR